MAIHRVAHASPRKRRSSVSALAPDREVAQTLSPRLGDALLFASRPDQDLDRNLAMLTGRQASMQEVAVACGFTSSNYLARVIREHTGLTPGQIRSGVRSG